MTPPSREEVARVIREHGRYCIGVLPDAGAPPHEGFTYTIGNAEAGFPELLLVGTCDVSWLLNLLSQRMIDRGHPFTDGEEVDIGAKCPVRVYLADDRVKGEYTIQGSAFYGDRDYQVMQVVVPDTRGRFPGDPGYDAVLRGHDL